MHNKSNKENDVFPKHIVAYYLLDVVNYINIKMTLLSANFHTSYDKKFAHPEATPWIRTQDLES